MSFVFEPLKIPDVIKITPKIFRDNRGYFLELNKKTNFQVNGINYNFRQDNFSLSDSNVIRGLHFQNPPYSQAKLVTVLKGKIFDVAVDLRRSSKYFKSHVSVVLDSNLHESVFIPEGFAHGFCALEDSTLVFYKNSKEYSPRFEDGIIWNDNALSIDWPVKKPILSDKDKSYKSLKDLVSNFD